MKSIKSNSVNSWKCLQSHVIGMHGVKDLFVTKRPICCMKHASTEVNDMKLNSDIGFNLTYLYRWKWLDHWASQNTTQSKMNTYLTLKEIMNWPIILSHTEIRGRGTSWPSTDSMTMAMETGRHRKKGCQESKEYHVVSVRQGDREGSRIGAISPTLWEIHTD